MSRANFWFLWKRILDNETASFSLCPGSVCSGIGNKRPPFLWRSFGRGMLGGRLLSCQSRPGLPEGTEMLVYVVIDTQMTGDLPCDHQQDFDQEKDGSNAQGSSQHEIEIHQWAKEGSQPNKQADHHGNSDQYFTNDDQFRESNIGIAVQQGL